MSQLRNELFTEDGKPNEENIRLAEEEFRKAIEEKDREREQKKHSQE